MKFASKFRNAVFYNRLLVEKEDKIKVLQSWYDNIKNYAGIINRC